MAKNCNEQKQNLGLTRCIALPQMFAGMFTTPLGWKIPAATILQGDTAIKQFIQDALLDPDPAKRIYLWPNFVGFEDAKEDAVYEETPLADLKVRDGKYRWRVQVQQDLCTHRAMGTHNGGNQAVVFIDIENQLFGMDNAEGDFLGLTASLINVEKLIISDGSTSTRTPIYIVLKNSKQIDKNGALLDADYIDELVRLTDVKYTVIGVPTGTTIVVTVVTKCDNTPVMGWVMDDFIKKAVDGTVQPIVSIAEVSGQYTLTGVGFTSGTVSSVGPDELSVEGFDGTSPVTVTITP